MVLVVFIVHFVVAVFTDIVAASSVVFAVVVGEEEAVRVGVVGCLFVESVVGASWGVEVDLG